MSSASPNENNIFTPRSQSWGGGSVGVSAGPWSTGPAASRPETRRVQAACLQGPRGAHPSREAWLGACSWGTQPEPGVLEGARPPALAAPWTLHCLPARPGQEPGEGLPRGSAVQGGVGGLKLAGCRRVPQAPGAAQEVQVSGEVQAVLAWCPGVPDPRRGAERAGPSRPGGVGSVSMGTPEGQPQGLIGGLGTPKPLT